MCQQTKMNWTSVEFRRCLETEKSEREQKESLSKITVKSSITRV